jgi:hypothetical protein
MASFKVTLTFDEVPTLKTHKELLKKELFDRVNDNEYFFKNISYTDKSVTLKGNKVIFKFVSDNDEKKTLDVMKRWADKNIKKSLAGRNKYYLDTYKVKKYKITVKENKKLKKAIQDYEKEWAKGGESRKSAIKKIHKTKKLYGGSIKKIKKNQKCKSKRIKRRYSYTRRR